MHASTRPRVHASSGRSSSLKLLLWSLGPAGSGAAALAPHQPLLRRHGSAHLPEPGRDAAGQQQRQRLLPSGESGHAPSCASHSVLRALRPAQMSPVAIVLVSDGQRCLLARQPAFPPGMYSALAGFCELGQSQSTPPPPRSPSPPDPGCVFQVSLWRRRPAGRWRRRWAWRSTASPTAAPSTGPSPTAPSCWAAMLW